MMKYITNNSFRYDFFNDFINDFKNDFLNLIQ